MKAASVTSRDFWMIPNGNFEGAAARGHERERLDPFDVRHRALPDHGH